MTVAKKEKEALPKKKKKKLKTFLKKGVSIWLTTANDRPEKLGAHLGAPGGAASKAI